MFDSRNFNPSPLLLRRTLSVFARNCSKSWKTLDFWTVVNPSLLLLRHTLSDCWKFLDFWTVSIIKVFISFASVDKDNELQAEPLNQNSKKSRNVDILSDFMIPIKYVYECTLGIYILLMYSMIIKI